MKNKVLILSLLCTLVTQLSQAQIANESYVLSSGGINATGTSISHYGVLGEAIVSSSQSVGTISQQVGFIFRTVSIQLTGINIALFLEGPYQGAGTMSTSLAANTVLPHDQPYNTAPWNYAGTESAPIFPAGAVDWILVELRDAPSAWQAYSFTVMDGWPKAMFLLQDGSVVDQAGNAPSYEMPVINDSLFVVIRHRNHIAVMSSHGMTPAADSFSYDFTDGLAKVYGEGAGYKELETGVFGLVAGDADADGNVFMSDRTLWRGDLGITLNYMATDFDLDANAFMSDRALWRANLGTANPVNGLFIKPLFVSQVPDKK
ncbi:MAG: hypothetical protein ACOYN5_15785 [Bacteroidales bacterium]